MLLLLPLTWAADSLYNAAAAAPALAASSLHIGWSHIGWSHVEGHCTAQKLCSDLSHILLLMLLWVLMAFLLLMLLLLVALMLLLRLLLCWLLMTFLPLLLLRLTANRSLVMVYCCHHFGRSLSMLWRSVFRMAVDCAVNTQVIPGNARLFVAACVYCRVLLLHDVAATFAVVLMWNIIKLPL